MPEANWKQGLTAAGGLVPWWEGVLATSRVCRVEGMKALIAVGWVDRDAVREVKVEKM